MTFLQEVKNLVIDTFQAAIAVSLPFEDEIHSDQTNWPKLKVLVAN